VSLDYTVQKYIDGLNGLPKATALSPERAVTLFEKRKAQKIRRQKRKERADVGTEYTNDTWWQGGNGFQAAADGEKRLLKKRRAEGLTEGARIEVYWRECEAGKGLAGYYAGTVVGETAGDECEHGDHLILYDDFPIESTIEQLLEGEKIERATWRFEEL
jgi:hypothetical protein